MGRADSCDTPLKGFKISREHAEIGRAGAQLSIRDLGSRNGVWVNGQRVDLASLRDGDVVRVGEWVGCVTPEFSRPIFAELMPGLWSGPRLSKLLEPARKLVARGIPLVIQGATGTGKERVARALHAWSGRQGAYVAVNCAALPGPLAESMLFGHATGAFTGAGRPHVGHFREADAGTLLLDEFLDLSARTQAKLLRVLEEREVQPLGDDRTYPVDVQLVAATQVSLAEMLQTGQIRSDLAARLGVCTLSLPPLCARREDIAPLFRHFTRSQTGEAPDLDSELIEWLCLQPWEQNVRELEWLARAMVALHADAPRLGLEHLPPSRSAAPRPTAAPSREPTPREPRPLLEHHALSEALWTLLIGNGGNVRQAAASLGITRQKAYRLLDRHSSVKLEGLRNGRLLEDEEPSG